MPLAGELVRASDIGVGSQSADVATSETTASGTYAALATAGPAVSVVLAVGQMALVIVSAYTKVSVNTAGARISYAVSGAETNAASDTDAAYTQNTDPCTITKQSLYTATVAGSHTFTAQYRTGGGLTGTYVDRRITVIPLNPA